MLQKSKLRLITFIIFLLFASSVPVLANEYTRKISVPGRNFSGSGTKPSVTWDGKYANGKIIDTGSHTATLRGQRVDKPGCGDSKPLNFTVTQGESDRQD